MAPPHAAFLWSEEETGILLEVTLKFKTECLGKGVQWDSCREKYPSIHALLLEEVDKKKGDAPAGTYHSASEYKLDTTRNKLKAIQNKFKQAVIKNTRSGMGRTVTVYWELCEEIWSGSASVDAVPNHTETQIGAHGGNSGRDSEEPDPIEEEQEEEANEGEGGSVADDPRGVKRKRDLLNEKISNYRNSKLTKKLTPQEESLYIAREELKIKRESQKTLAAMERRHTDTMAAMTAMTGFLGRITSVMERSSGTQAAAQLPPNFPYAPSAAYGNPDFNQPFPPPSSSSSVYHQMRSSMPDQYPSALSTSRSMCSTPVCSTPSPGQPQSSSTGEYSLLQLETPVRVREDRNTNGRGTSNASMNYADL